MEKLYHEKVLVVGFERREKGTLQLDLLPMVVGMVHSIFQTMGRDSEVF